MQQQTKENIQLVVGIVLLSALNGAAGARVIYGLIREHYKKRETENRRKIMSEATFYSVLTRLKKQGIVENTERGVWRLTVRGKRVADAHITKRDAYADFIKNTKGRRDTIIIFDVPESRRKLRDYLRMEIVSLGYEQLQKSVWIGAGPLPEAFIGFLNEKKIIDTVHIFTIQEKGTIVG